MFSSGEEGVSDAAVANNICEICMNLENRGSSMVFTRRNQYSRRHAAANVGVSYGQPVAERKIFMHHRSIMFVYAHIDVIICAKS